MVPTFQQVMQSYPLWWFKKGETLFLKGDIPTSVYVIEQGVVQAYTITADGVEREVSLHTKGDDIPVGFGLGLAESAEYFYRAHSDCAVRVMPREKFIKSLRADAAELYRRHVHMDELLIKMLARINALERPRANDKVAYLLLSATAQISSKLRPYKTRFRLAITQQEIANALGMTRETAAVAIKYLEVKKVLVHTRKSYTIYVDRLRKYLEDK